MTPARAANFQPERTIIVILGARNEGRLANLERRLTASGVSHVAIRESDAPWNGALMAIGLTPCEELSDEIQGVLNRYQTFKSYDGDGNSS